MVLIIALVQHKEISINFSNAKTKVCLKLITMVIRVNCTYRKQICNFKVNDNISWHHFCLGSILKHFTKDEQSEIYLINL